MAKIKCGLEIHVYLDVSETSQKLFCCCPIIPNAKPNIAVCPRCTANPGAKPMLPNKEAIEKVIKAALMLNCKINSHLLWQRKHYDWPDLPKGYQTTMSGSYAVPVGEKGHFLGIDITEVHLEEDPARWNPVTGEIDYNRCGYPLIEIVTEPDFKSIPEVRDWLKSLIRTLSYIKAVNKSLGVKCDVNVSIAPTYQRVEIKNVNSFKSIVKVIDAEAARQEKEISAGQKIESQTRTWVEAEGLTKFMRSKEQALDYRFIPDPDLPPVEIKKELLKKLKKQLPESPEVKTEKLIKFGIDKTTAEIIARDLYLTDFLEKNKEKVNLVFLANWLRKEVSRVLNLEKKEFEEAGFNHHHLLELAGLWQDKEITAEIGRELLEQLVKKDFSPADYVKKKSLGAIKEGSELEKPCREAIKENNSAVKDYQKGSEKALNALVGSVMKKTQGKASPHQVKEILKRLLKQ